MELSSVGARCALLGIIRVQRSPCAHLGPFFAFFSNHNSCCRCFSSSLYDLAVVQFGFFFSSFLRMGYFETYFFPCGEAGASTIMMVHNSFFLRLFPMNFALALSCLVRSSVAPGENGKNVAPVPMLSDLFYGQRIEQYLHSEKRGNRSHALAFAAQLTRFGTENIEHCV